MKLYLSGVDWGSTLSVIKNVNSVEEASELTRSFIDEHDKEFKYKG